MNIRKIVTYNALRRQFTAEELAFADVLFNATESERDLLITALQPEKPAGKKASRKSSKKSARASSLGAAVKGSLQRREPTVGGFADDADMVRCTAMVDDNGGEMECGETIDNNVHHKRTDPNFHPFVSTAQPAPAPSPANGEGTSSTQNSEASAASAGAVTGGSSE